MKFTPKMKSVLGTMAVFISCFVVASEPGNETLWELLPAFSTGTGIDPRAEVLGRVQWRILEDRSFFLGPRVGILTERNGSSLVAGISATQWLASAVGAQFSGEYLVGLSGTKNGLRVNPSLAIRLFHLGENGAVAGDAGFLWDSRTQWGMRIGLIFEWGALYSARFFPVSP